MNYFILYLSLNIALITFQQSLIHFQLDNLIELLFENIGIFIFCRFF